MRGQEDCIKTAIRYVHDCKSSACDPKFPHHQFSKDLSCRIEEQICRLFTTTLKSFNVRIHTVSYLSPLARRKASATFGSNFAISMKRDLT